MSVGILKKRPTSPFLIMNSAEVIAEAVAFYIRSSHFNTSDGSSNAAVADVSTTSRYVSTPSGGEGTPFYTNGWSGALHAVTRTSPLTWATAGKCSFIDATTTFNILIKDGNSPQTDVVDFTTAAITGDGAYSGSDCVLTITNWAAEGDRFMADVSLEVDINTIFPNGGYFDIVISHIDGADGTFTKSQ